MSSASIPCNIKRLFDCNTTALEVINHYKTDLTGRTAIVTGGASGIGITTVYALASAGANVIVAARDTQKSIAVVDEILKSLPKANIEFQQLDLASLKSIRAFADKFNSRNIALNLLIENAGVMLCPFSKTEDGFEMQIGTNHLGHFLLANLLIPSLLLGAPSRVIVLSSSGHRFINQTHWDDLHYDKFPYDKAEAYGQSKLANILFAKEFNRLYSSKGITSNAVHPGSISTNLQRNVTDEDRKMFATIPYTENRRFKTVEQGSSTTIWAAVAPELEGIGGYFLQDTWFADKENTSKSPLGGISDLAEDMQSAKQLWDISVEQVKLNA